MAMGESLLGPIKCKIEREAVVRVLGLVKVGSELDGGTYANVV
jgi:hypothetical protein